MLLSMSKKLNHELVYYDSVYIIYIKKVGKADEIGVIMVGKVGKNI